MSLVRPELNEIQKENGERANVVGKLCHMNYFKTVHTSKNIDPMSDTNKMYETEIRNIVISRENIQTRLEKLNVNNHSPICTMSSCRCNQHTTREYL